MIIYEDDNSTDRSYFYMNEMTEAEKQEVMRYEYEQEHNENTKSAA